jgi:hypothetical protein
MVMSTASQGPSGGTLTEVLELILDRGVVIDIYARVSLVGIEILTIDARIVVASVDTYLRYADAVGRLNLDSGPKLGAQDLLAGNYREGDRGGQGPARRAVCRPRPAGRAA